MILKWQSLEAQNFESNHLVLGGCTLFRIEQSVKHCYLLFHFMFQPTLTVCFSD